MQTARQVRTRDRDGGAKINTCPVVLRSESPSQPVSSFPKKVYAPRISLSGSPKKNQHQSETVRATRVLSEVRFKFQRTTQLLERVGKWEREKKLGIEGGYGRGVSLVESPLVPGRVETEEEPYNSGVCSPIHHPHVRRLVPIKLNDWLWSESPVVHAFSPQRDAVYRDPRAISLVARLTCILRLAVAPLRNAIKGRNVLRSWQSAFYIIPDHEAF